MKYFKCTSEFDPEDEFYTSSSSDKTTAEDIADFLRLDHYKVEECTKEEFERETEEDVPEGLLFGRQDMDLPLPDEDWDGDWEDEDDEFVD